MSFRRPFFENTTDLRSLARASGSALRCSHFSLWAQVTRVAALALSSLLVLTGCYQEEEPPQDGAALPAPFRASVKLENGKLEQGVYYTQNLNVVVQVTGANMTEMYVTSTPGCTRGGLWQPIRSPFSYTLTQANAVNTVYVQFRNGGFGGPVSECLSVSITHDDIAPIMSVSSPLEASWVNSGNATALAVSGSCSEDGRYVSVVGPQGTSSVPCSAGAFTWPIDVSSASDGAVNLEFRHVDAAGNPASVVTRQLQKDTVAPSVAVISPAAGSLIDQTQHAAYAVTGTCSESGTVIITGDAAGTATCSSGSWSANLDFSSAPNGAVSISVIQQDVAGNSSAVATRSFVHQAKPVLTFTLPLAGTYVNAANAAAWTVGGDCGAEGQAVLISGAVSASATCASGQWSTSLNLTSLSDGLISLTVNHSYASGGAADPVTRNFTKDTVLPTLAIAAPATGSWITPANVASFTVSGTCSEAGRQVSVTGAVTASTACVSGTWSVDLNLTSVSDGGVNLNFTQVDLAGNSGTVSRSFNKDVSVPTVSIAAPLASAWINSANAANWLMSGSCSEEGRDINFSGAVSGSVSCMGGAWSVDLDLSGIVDGSVAITVTHADAAGNSASVSRSYSKDTVAPTLLWVSPLAGTAMDAIEAASFAIEASCEAGLNVSVSGSVSTTALCVAGVAHADLDLTGVADGTVNLTLSQTDAAGNSSSASRVFTKDTVAPAITITSPAAGSTINVAAASAFALSGTCSEPGASVEISGAVTATAACSSGSFSVVLDLSAVADGTVSLTVSQTDLVGNIGTASRSFVKDTSVPTSVSLVIAGGTEAVVSTSVTLTLAATGATQMYVTNTAGCASGGTWQAYATSRAWTLPAANSLNEVYVKFRNSALNESACVSDDIWHDTIAPTWTVGASYPSSYNSINLSPWVTFNADATDDESGVDTYEYAIGTGTSGTAQSDVLAWTEAGSSPFQVTGLSLSIGATYYLHMRVRDVAGNQLVVPHTTGWLVNIVAPVLTITSPANGLVTTEIDQPIIGACEAGRLISVSYTGDVSGPAAIVCEPNGTYRFAATSSGANGTREIELSMVDSLFGTITAQVSYDLLLTQFTHGTVWSVLNLPDGGRLIGGSFSGLSRYTTRYIAKLKASDASRVEGGFSGGFNGTVNAMVRLSNGQTLVGGAFTTYRGLIANRIALLEADGSLNLSFNSQYQANGTNDTVNALLVDGDGVWLGGAFTTYRGAVANRLTKISLASGQIDTAFSPQIGANGAGGTVNALAFGSDGGSLWVGGAFTAYRGLVANRVAKVNRDSGILDQSVSPQVGDNGAGNTVLAIAVDGADVYLGGTFTAYRTLVANRVAKIDSATGALDTNFNPATSGNGVNNTVRALAINSTHLYIGGDFTTYRGVTVNRITKVSRANFGVDTAFNPPAGGNGFSSGAVYALGLEGSSVWVGGTFVAYRGASASYLARLDTTTGEADLDISPASGATLINNAVYAFDLSRVASDDEVLMGGPFTAGPPEYTALNIARLAADDTVDTTFSPQSGANGTNNTVYAILASGDTVYVGGAFTSYRGAVANRVAKLSLSTGAPDTTFSPSSGGNGASAEIRALQLSGDGLTLYLGGNFSSYRGSAANRVAKVHAQTGALDTTFNPPTGANGANSFVYALWLDGVDLYIGGNFTTYRGTTVTRLAKVNSSSGVLNSTFHSVTTGANGIVYALRRSGDWLYLVGAFTSHRGSVANRVARVNRLNGSVDLVFNPATGGNGVAATAWVLEMDSTHLYVGGQFTSYRGQVANRLARVSLADGALDTTLSPPSGANGFNSTVYALSWNSSTARLTCGGVFTTYRGRNALYLREIASNGGL